MQTKLIFAALMIVGLATAGQALAQATAEDQEFQQLSAALKANDTERQAAIATCIKQGIGDNPAGAAKLMGVPIEKAAEAWCTRITNGIADAKLRLADLNELNQGTVTLRAREVLTTVSEGK